MKSRKRLRHKGRKIFLRFSLRWTHMLMMMSILLISVFALGLIHQKSADSLTDEHLAKIRITLDRDCKELNDTMFMTSAIPAGIEGTRYYDYIKTETSGKMETKYYSVLHYIGAALNNQVYLKGDSDACLLYLAGTNTIITETYFPVAEECFDEYLLFSETDGETIMDCLRERNSMTVLPAQNVKIGKNNEEKCITLIIRPRDSNVAVMTIYSEARILDKLGLSYLPEETFIQMVAEDGQCLYQYPETPPDQLSNNHFLLSSKLDKFNIEVKLWVPQSYFSQLIRPIQLVGTGTILTVTLVGMILSFFFSKVTVVPIRRLIETHGETSEPEITNEITHLDRLLRSSRQQLEGLQISLTRQLLSRVFSGSILSDYEETQLRKELDSISENYRVAIFHTTPDINTILGEHMQQSIENSFWALLSDKETGLVFPGSDACLSKLMDEIQVLNLQLLERGVHCGISAQTTNFDSLHISVRQARVALPQEVDVKVFQGKQVEGHSHLRVLHERLFQSISADDEEETIRLLRIIASQTNYANGKELFYNIRFVFSNAANEMNLTLDQEQLVEYQPSFLPCENIRKLESMVHDLFSCIRAKKQESTEDLQNIVLDYIQQNLSEYELCAAVVAEHFQLPEKKVYEIVRNKTEMSFKEYLTSLRMKKAADLLYATKDGINDIAQACGYRGSSTFYRLFQEYYGQAPGQYRKDSQQNTSAEAE